jgi:hypothetical protein
MLLRNDEVFVHGLDVLRISENESLIHIEASGNDVSYVLPCELLDLWEAEFWTV